MYVYEAEVFLNEIRSFTEYSICVVTFNENAMGDASNGITTLSRYELTTMVNNNNFFLHIFDHFLFYLFKICILFLLNLNSL